LTFSLDLNSVSSASYMYIESENCLVGRCIREGRQCSDALVLWWPCKQVWGRTINKAGCVHCSAWRLLRMWGWCPSLEERYLFRSLRARQCVDRATNWPALSTFFYHAHKPVFITCLWM